MQRINGEDADFPLSTAGANAIKVENGLVVGDKELERVLPSAAGPFIQRGGTVPGL